jgi:hypothetical protein
MPLPMPKEILSRTRSAMSSSSSSEHLQKKPSHNLSASRMALALDEAEIEIAPRMQAEHRTNVQQEEACNMLQQHNEKRRPKTKNPKLTEDELKKRSFCRKLTFALVVLQGMAVPAMCIYFAITLANFGRADCVRANNHTSTLHCTQEDGDLSSFALFVPAGFSFVLLSGCAYRERGPGGVLEHSGARLGCLPVTAIDPNAFEK